MVLTVFLGSLGAYALSRFALKGKRLFMMAALLPQFFPYVLVLIPFYVLMSNLNLVDTHVGLILTHTSLMLPFAPWMLTGYFNAIPMELDQAALIDGCSRFGVLFRILYPVAIPGLVVAGFFAFVVSWGDYLFVSILSQSNETQTLPIGLQTFMSSSLEVQWGLITAGTVLAIVPTVIFFSIGLHDQPDGYRSATARTEPPDRPINRRTAKITGENRSSRRSEERRPRCRLCDHHVSTGRTGRLKTGHRDTAEIPEWNSVSAIRSAQAVYFERSGRSRFLIDLCLELDDFAPDALLLNYVNPMAANCWAIDAATLRPHVGLCHSVQGTSEMIAKWIDVPYNEVTFFCAGINHQAFFLEFWRGKEDLYPSIWEAIEHPEIYAQEPIRIEAHETLRILCHGVQWSCERVRSPNSGRARRW